MRKWSRSLATVSLDRGHRIAQIERAEPLCRRFRWDRVSTHLRSGGLSFDFQVEFAGDVGVALEFFLVKGRKHLGRHG